MATNVGTAFFLFWGLLRAIIYWARKALIIATLAIAVIVASVVGTSMYREVEYNKAARTYLAKGTECLRLTNYNAASVQLQKVITKYPKSRWVENAQLGMGVVWEGLGDYGLAIEALKQVVRNYPDGNRAPDAQYGIGDIYESKLKDYERAIEAYQRVVDKYPQTEQARWALLRINSIKAVIGYRLSVIGKEEGLGLPRLIGGR